MLHTHYDPDEQIKIAKGLSLSFGLEFPHVLLPTYHEQHRRIFAIWAENGSDREIKKRWTSALKAMRCNRAEATTSSLDVLIWPKVHV